jgi:hypothetical protein
MPGSNTGGWFDYQGDFDKYATQGTPKPTVKNDMIVDWTQDPKVGDSFYTGEGSGQGWYPIWSNSQKGAELKTQAADTKISDQQALLADPNSKYYTDYYSKLKGTLSAQSSLNSLLGLNRAMGLGMEGSATIANQQRQALQGKITDYAGQSTKDLFQANLGQSNSLLGMGLQNSQFQQGYQFQQKQYQDAQKFDWSQLASTAGNILGYALAPATGGASIFANTAIQGGMSFLNKTPNPTQGRNTNFSNWGNWGGQ